MATKVNLQLLSQLRKQTQHSLKKITQALLATNNDSQLALKMLHSTQPSASTLSALASRQTTQGLISTTGTTKRIMIELNCETDFVARSEIFVSLTTQIAASLWLCYDDLLEVEKGCDGSVHGLMRNKAGVWSIDVNSSLNVPVSPLNQPSPVACTQTQSPIEPLSMQPVQSIKALIESHIALTGEQITLRRIAAVSTKIAVVDATRTESSIPGSFVHGNNTLGYGRIGCLIAMNRKTGTLKDIVAVEKIADKMAQNIVGMGCKDVDSLLSGEYLFGGSVKDALASSVDGGLEVDSLIRFEVGEVIE